MTGIATVRRTIGRIGIARSAITAVLIVTALLVARYSWHAALSQQAERWMYDTRLLVTAPQVEEDPRIVEVIYTDDTLRLTARRSPLDRGLLARVLTRIDKMGAQGIGIDMLIDEPQAEDPQLIAAMRAMRTPVYLGFATNATNPDAMAVWQEAFERKLFAALAGSNVHPASIKLETDPEDGVVRSWPHPDPSLPPTLVASLAGPGDFAHYDRGIAYRLPQLKDRDVFTWLPIETLDSDLGARFLADRIAGKIVLMGGHITDVDQFDTPVSRLTRRTDSGLDIHAAMLAQRLDGTVFATISPSMIWLMAIIAILSGAAIGASEARGWRLMLLLAACMVTIVLLPVALQRWQFDTQGLPAFGWLVGWTLAYIAASAAARGIGSEQRRFAQGALGRYLPRDVATAILKDPGQLKLHGERATIFALFSDMEGFTTLTHAIEPETLSVLFNRYLDLLSNIVLDHGGTIDKFVGDAIVAFWGAPIARPDDGDRALAACITIAEAGEAFRRDAPAGLPPIGRTRVGLHRGEVVVGNFGGEGRIQYTALGDAMNTAARLEGANKGLSTRALVSAEAAAGMTDPPLRPMGRVVLRGRSTPVQVFEPVPEMSRSDIDALSELLRRFDAGDASAMQDLGRYAAARGDDTALTKLLARLAKIGPGGHHALD